MLNLTKDIKTVKITANPDSYSTFVYGPAKIGKSTFVKKLYGKDVLFLMTEPRDQALVGADVAQISNWADFVGALDQLEHSKALHKKYSVIAIDTVDNLVRFVEDYVKETFSENQLGDNVGFGKDYAFCKDLWNKYVTSIHSLGYTPVYIGHSKNVTIKIPANSTDKDSISGDVKEVREGKNVYYEFNQAQPDLPEKYWNPINKSVDQILYLSSMLIKGDFTRVIHLRNSVQWIAGSTFPKIKPTILDSAKIYRQTLTDAVNYYSKKDQTTAKYNKLPKKVDFKALMQKAKKLGYEAYKKGHLTDVKKIVNDIFGSDMKLEDAKPSQAQQVELAMIKMKKLVG